MMHIRQNAFYALAIGVAYSGSYTLGFRSHRIAMIADVSRTYRAVLLARLDKDLHRFVWRNNPNDQLRDYRMTRITFGVSASSFIANICIKQNAIDFGSQYPRAAFK